MRGQVQLFKKYQTVDDDGDAMMDEDFDDNFPDVQVDELLDKINTINLNPHESQFG